MFHKNMPQPSKDQHWTTFSKVQVQIISYRSFGECYKMSLSHVQL